MRDQLMRAAMYVENNILKGQCVGIVYSGKLCNCA